MTSFAANAYQDEIIKLRERNDFLEEENRQLRRGSERSADILEFRIPNIRLTRCECRVLNALISDSLLTRDAIYNSLYADAADAPDIRLIDSFVYKLRCKLKPLNIEIRTVWGCGYSMAAADRQTLKGCLVQAVTRIGVADA